MSHVISQVSPFKGHFFDTGIGSVIPSVAGAALGSFFGPAGTIAGAALGGGARASTRDASLASGLLKGGALGLGAAGGIGAATGTLPGGLTIPGFGGASTGAAAPPNVAGSAGVVGGSAGSGAGAGLPLTAAGADVAGSGSPFGVGAAGGSSLAPATATPAAAPATQSGLGGVLSKVGAFGKSLLPSGPGGFVLPAALASSLILGQRKIPEAGALQADQALQGPALASAQSAQAGNITPAQQAQIDKWTQQQKEQVKQYLQTSGQGADSTAAQQMLANVDAQALALHQGFADQLLSQSMQELGVADASTQALINLKLQQQQDLSNSLGQFMMSYGLLGGLNGRNA